MEGGAECFELGCMPKSDNSSTKFFKVDENTLSCLATSLAEDPETSIHVFENKAHADSINTM